MIVCEFINTNDFAIFSQPSYMTVKSTLFEKIVTTYNNFAACILCNADKIYKGDYLFDNTTFIDCRSDDFGVVNVPNVKFIIRSCQLINCKSIDADEHIHGHGFMITDDGLLPILIDNCTFMNNDISNEGSGLYIDRSYYSKLCIQG